MTIAMWFHFFRVEKTPETFSRSEPLLFHPTESVPLLLLWKRNVPHPGPT